MARPRRGIADHDDNQVLAFSNGIEPAAEQTGIGKPPASADLVRIGQGLSNAGLVFGEQIRMTFADVCRARSSVSSTSADR